MSDVPIRIIQISDSHLYQDPNRSLLGVKTNESFLAVIQLIRAQEKNLDLILLTGDLSQDGSRDSYLRIAEELKMFNVPVYSIPGNHDNFKMMQQVYPYETISTQRHVILKNWHFILLDSQIPSAVAGYLDPSQQDFLQDCLQQYPEHYAIVVMHHQPVPVGSYWLDKLGLTNADLFWHLLASYPKVHTVLFGHVHQVHETVVQHVKCYSAPSTCFQFKSHQDHFGLEHLPPGYRWLNLYQDGRLETGVKRVDHYVGEFEAHAKGY